MSYYRRKPKTNLSMTNIDKDVMTFDGRRVKLTRITSLKDLKAGTRYLRFGVNHIGGIIHSDMVIIGQAYGCRSEYLGSAHLKIKTINSYRNKAYESDYFVSDLGLGNRGDSLAIYKFNAKTERLLNYICDQGKVEEALKLTRGFNFDVANEIEETRLADEADREMYDSYLMLDDDR